MKTETDSAVTETLLYHEQTKHHFRLGGVETVRLFEQVFDWKAFD